MNLWTVVTRVSEVVCAAEDCNAPLGPRNQTGKCKTCYKAEWHQANKARMLAKQQAKRAENREQYLADGRSYYARNRERILAQMAEQYRNDEDVR